MTISRMILFIFILSVLLTGCNQGILVIVTNNSGADINNVKINFKGGSTEALTLHDGQIFRKYVKPTSESDLIIQFVSKEGQLIKKRIDVYFEKNYSGSITITIGSGYQVTVKSDIHL